MTTNDDGQPGRYASPPCFMHALDGDNAAPGGDPAARADVARWRKAERQRLIESRLAISADERVAMSGRIATGLDTLVGSLEGRIVSLYWPFRGEPDLRAWMASVNERGGRTALPVVLEKGRPLVFRAYAPGDRLERGVWNIPQPAEDETVLPDIVLSPVVGFDTACYRLGYGGGFFDRTLAAAPRRPLVIGVGYDMQALPTIYPQPHDIAMDVIVTETGTKARRSSWNESDI